MNNRWRLDGGRWYAFIDWNQLRFISIEYVLKENNGTTISKFLIIIIKMYEHYVFEDWFYRYNKITCFTTK